MRASNESAGKSRSQHSQFGLNSSIVSNPGDCRHLGMVREKVAFGEQLSL
jgi:hypothetical protein